MGSGTTADVCIGLGRRSIGIELSEDYIRSCQIPRIKTALMNYGLSHLTGHVVKKVVFGK